MHCWVRLVALHSDELGKTGNTVEKYNLETQLKNTFEKCNWEIQLKNTIDRYSWEVHLTIQLRAGCTSQWWMGQNYNSRPSRCSSSISSFSPFWLQLSKILTTKFSNFRPKFTIQDIQNIEHAQWALPTCFSVASYITDLILHPNVHCCIIYSISWYMASYMVVGGNLRHNKVASGNWWAGVGVGVVLLPRSRHGMDTSSHNAAAAHCPGSDTITWLPLLWAGAPSLPQCGKNILTNFQESFKQQADTWMLHPLNLWLSFEDEKYS